VKQGLTFGKKKKKHSSDELDVKKPLVVSVSQKSEKLKLYNVVQNFRISNASLKAISSNEPYDRTVRFLEMMIWVFWKGEISQKAPMPPLNTSTFSLSSNILSMQLTGQLIKKEKIEIHGCSDENQTDKT
jgi:hypothetical protein